VNQLIINDPYTKALLEMKLPEEVELDTAPAGAKLQSAPLPDIGPRLASLAKFIDAGEGTLTKKSTESA
jgi:hypothetical protein